MTQAPDISGIEARPLDERFIRNPLASRDGPDGLELSALDREIIRVLQHDGRRSFARIARDVGVTEKTVRRRVERLRAKHIISITTVADPALVGYGSSALVGVRVDPGASAFEVAAELAAFDAIDYVVMSTGSFQILAEVLCRDSAELIATLETRVRRVPGVVAYESFPYLRLYYQQPEWDAARQKRGDDGLRGGPLPTIDDLDRRILVELNADGRAPLGQISSEVGASESLVRQRINRLVDSGAVKVMALTNPLSLGFGLIAWLGIVAAPGVKLGDLADQLAERGSITYLAICAGRFDIFAELICSGEQELLARLDEEIRPLKGVERVEVWLCSDLHYKRLQPRF